ncbi:MAG: hypothetical protein E7545_07895 [Ruminococcaceae bacterium]|nr:hypothetical protein [Oscillospiraceae bacterium]
MSGFKTFLKTFVISGWCLVLFIGLGYYYIKSHDIRVENEVESVPYYTQTPDSKGVLFKFSKGSVYTYLDFDLSTVTVILNPESVDDMGYTTDYTVNANYSLIAYMCDYFDGINLTLNAETLRYTGNQVVELIINDTSTELRIKVIDAIFRKINGEGIGVDFLNSIVTKSETNLKIPDCYFWAEFMDDISKNIKFLSH